MALMPCALVSLEWPQSGGIGANGFDGKAGVAPRLEAAREWANAVDAAPFE